MKLIRSLSAALCGVGLVAAATAQQNSNPVKFELPQVGAAAPAPSTTTPATTATTPAATAPAAPAQTFTEAQMMEVYGWMTGVRMNLQQLEFTPAQVEALSRGLKMAAAGEQPNYDAQQMGPQLQAFLAQKQQTLLTKIRNFNLNAAAEFFTKLKEDPAVKELPGSNGLRYKVVTEGKGAVAKPGQIARIHYTGAFLNGQIFDTSLQAPEGQTPQPVEALIQEGNLVTGILEALTRMPVGSKWILYIPPHLAFGDDGAPGIPPAATLLYEIEVFEVKDAPKPPAGAKK